VGRKKRKLEQPCCYHITHRCQERRFLFKHRLDRWNYVKRLRQMVEEYDVDVLNYIVTSNHVHLLLFARRATDVSAALHFLQGTTAGDFNRRVKREGAFWRGRYHPTLIEKGPHLGRCVFYIDLNMVRAGVVEHPVEWMASGHHELSGRRQRYTLLNIPQLIRCMGHDPQIEGCLEHFREWYANTLDEKLAEAYHAREPFWSEASAIGSEAFVTDLAGPRLSGRIDEIPRLAVGEAEPLYQLTLSSREKTALWARQQQ
jgi:putative transposase